MRCPPGCSPRLRVPCRAQHALLAAWAFGAVLAGCGDDRVTPDDVPEISLTALVTIRPDGSGEEVPFGRVADLEIGGDGSLFVLDDLDRTVRVFDQRGTALRVFGRRGQGPGEFEEPGHLLWGPDGNLRVLDLRNGRLTVFDPEGRLVGTHRPFDLPIVVPLALGFSGPDTLRLVGVTSPDPAAPAAAWFETRVVADEVRPIARHDLPFVEWPLLFEHRSADMALVQPVPFSGEPLFGFDPSGRLWYAYTGSSTLHGWSPSGGIDLTFGRDLSPAPVTSADRARAVADPELDELRHAIGQAGVAELSAMIPDARPYLAGFFFDDDGWIWVIRAPRDVSAGPQRTIDIYDSGGTPVATAHVAVAAAPTPRVRNGLLAGVVRDSLDVESVVLYRVNR